jgi:hypothetical protein
VKTMIAAIVAKAPTYLMLTAGRDSRLLLACARGVAEKIDLVTFQIPDDEDAYIDCDIAGRIARRFGLRHQRVQAETPTEDDLREYMFRISDSTGEVRGWRCATMYKRLPGGHAVLLANANELGGSRLWQSKDTERSVITPERLLEACRCPPLEEPLARTRAWMKAVPVANALQLLDMYYLEQRLGCWAGVTPYAECDIGFAVQPMSHRDVIERLLQLPIPFRRAGALTSAIIEREWPELLDWPFNVPVGPERVLFEARRAARFLKRMVVNPAREFQLARDVITGKVPLPRRKR